MSVTWKASRAAPRQHCDAEVREEDAPERQSAREEQGASASPGGRLLHRTTQTAHLHGDFYARVSIPFVCIIYIP